MIDPNRAYLVDAEGVVLSTNDPESLEAARACRMIVAEYGERVDDGSTSNERAIRSLSGRSGELPGNSS